jgi:hypothetical protein
VADIFISYTSQDREWANWIGLELEALGHVPYIHDWEISAGGNIMEWMEQRLEDADHVLCIVSAEYLKKPYSSLERHGGQWAAVTKTTWRNYRIKWLYRRDGFPSLGMTSITAI